MAGGSAAWLAAASLRSTTPHGSFRVEASGRNLTIRRGDVISLNGTTGEVMLGAVPLADPELPDDLTRLMAWGDDARRLGVRANADTPEDAARAHEFGAEGIGLAAPSTCSSARTASSPSAR